MLFLLHCNYSEYCSDEQESGKAYFMVYYRQPISKWLISVYFNFKPALCYINDKI